MPTDGGFGPASPEKASARTSSLSEFHAATLDKYFAPFTTGAESQMIRKVMNDVAAQARTALGLPDSPDR